MKQLLRIIPLLLLWFISFVVSSFGCAVAYPTEDLDTMGDVVEKPMPTLGTNESTVECPTVDCPDVPICDCPGLGYQRIVALGPTGGVPGVECEILSARHQDGSDTPVYGPVTSPEILEIFNLAPVIALECYPGGIPWDYLEIDR